MSTNEDRVRAAGSQPRDWWPATLFGLHLGQGFLFAYLYPYLVYDTDLLAYFVYFRSWVDGSTGLHDLAFFTVPKPLLVFVLGALGRPSLAFYCSALASAALGSVAYLLGRDVFGRTVGIMLSVFLLLDVEKAVLTVKCKADLFVALFFLLALYAAVRRRLVGSSIWLCLSALVKPVTLPCAAYYVVADGARRRRWLCALVPLAAIPLILLSNRLLLGTALGPTRFFAGYNALREGTPIGPAELLHFVVWTQLIKHAFISTAPLGFLGLAVWLARDRNRLTSPLLLLPLLFLTGYLLLGVVTPYAPFFRFYWPVQLWFLGFILFGMQEVARRLARGRPRLAAGLAGMLLLFLVDDHLGAQLTYRERLALPFGQAMEFVSSTAPVLRRERRSGETIATPIAFVPYLMLEVDVPANDLIVISDHPVPDAPSPRKADWILYMADPRTPTDALARLVGQAGYEVRLSDGSSALLALPAASRAGAGEPGAGA
jgi:hypothetical protein